MRTEPTGPAAAPLEPAQAARALEEASDREQIFDLLLRAARSRMRYAALLSVHAGELRGRRALADDGFDTSRIATLQIPRDAVPALESAIASRGPAVAALATGEPFLDGLIEELGGSPPAALILPAAIGPRTVALVIAHRGDAPLPATDVAELIPLVDAIGPALARAVAARAHATGSAPRRATTGVIIGTGNATASGTIGGRPDTDGYEVEVLSEDAEPDAGTADAGTADAGTAGGARRSRADTEADLSPAGASASTSDAAAGPPTGPRPHATAGPPGAGPHATAGPPGAGPHVAAGPQAAGPHVAGPHVAGPHVAGPHVAGPRAAGPHVAGLHVAGPRAAGPRAAGPRAAGPPAATSEPAAAPPELAAPDAVAKRAVIADLRRRGEWLELADALRDLVRDGMEHGTPDEDEQLQLLLELGRIEADRLGRPDRAIEAWRGAQTIDAAEPRVLDALHGVLSKQARWAELAELLEKRAALAEDARTRLALVLELAAVARDRLDDEERAIAAYERVLGWDAAHPAASRELEVLYAGRGDWQPLAELLLDRASRSDDLDALETVAHIYEDKVGDPRAALLVWLAVLRRAPHAPHLLEQLERLGPTADAWDEIIAECSTTATELERFHPDVAARVWHLVGRWHRDHTANREAAARALDRALRANRDDLDALTELIELLRADARWPELIELLARRADAAPDRARRAELYAELGELHERRLGQPIEAIAWYERALADAPEAAPEATPVLVELHRLYLDTAAWEPLAELLPRLVDALAPTAPRTVLVDLHVERAGVLADHLGRPADAVQAYRDALALDPAHAAAYRGLARIYEATGQTDAVLDATEAELDADPTPAGRRRYADVAAAWFELGRADRAAAAWRKLLAVEPRSVAAHQGLARALRATAEWPALIAAQRALVALPLEPPARIEALLELASLLEDRLGDTEGAIAAYQEVTALAPEHRGALHALARLHEAAGRLPQALAALQRLLELTPSDFPARADLLQRIGHVHLGARDAANARVHFAQAIALDRDSAPAHEGLARVHIQQGELVAAGEELVRAAQLAASPDDAIRCLADAAWLYRHRLDDAERARACLHRILERDPAHADAKQALAELLADSRRWEELWPHLELEVARARDDTARRAAERLALFERAARCAVELGRFPAAMELYDLACALTPSPRPQLLLDRADALYRSKALEAAAASYQTIAVQHVGSLERLQLLALYRRLAQIHTALGKASQAQMFHNKVLDLDPRHRETLEDLVELNLARGRADEAVASLRTLAAGAPPAERAPLLERIGDLYRDKLANTARATSTYLEALELDASNHRILQRLLDLQTDAGQWKQAVDTIDRFLDHETDAARRGSYFLASAEIRRTELRDRPGAIAAYEAALDELIRDGAAPTRARAVDAFRALHDLLAGEQAWKQLEQSYRRMIKRLPAGDPLLVQLWHALGEIYRTGLAHTQSALEAFEVAHALDPDKSPQRARIIAELSGRGHKHVELDPTSPEAYRAVGRAGLAAGRVDEAWCASRALVFLKQATPEEEALYRRYQAHEVRKATGILDDEAWGHLRHPDEDRAISAIFALVWEAAVAPRAGAPKTFELKDKERMPVEEGTGVIAKIFRHAARVLHVPLPEVYVQPRRSGRLLLANTVERGRLAPAVIVGRDLMTGYRDTELAASVGAMLALLRPAYYLRLALPAPGELEAALAAAARLAGAKVARPELEAGVVALLPSLQKRVPRAAVDALRALVARLPATPDLGRWRTAVDTAAQRAGLLISGELAASARMLSTETAALGAAARPAQRVHELVGFSVSPGYFALRQHLGVAVG